MEKLVRVGLTHGDFNGVGLEVILKALADETILELMTPVIFTDMRLVEYARRVLGLEVPSLRSVRSAEDAEEGYVNVVDMRLSDTTVRPGHPDAVSGAAAVASLEAAVRAYADNAIDVIVTAPISKEAVQSDSFRYSGHTEYFGARANGDFKPQMILFDDMMRVALVTIHEPISAVAAMITKEKVKDSISRFESTLKIDFNIIKPKIAVLSLNPHCGDGGLLGDEEITAIRPAIDECAEEGCLAFGPFAADGFFGSGAYRKFDGILAMYHDQGLAPFKTLSGSNGVNFTAGLPIVRTSPDHGTACDIAWTGKADETSMREAIYRAIDIYRNRQSYARASANPLKHQPVERPAKPQYKEAVRPSEASVEQKIEEK